MIFHMSDPNEKTSPRHPSISSAWKQAISVDDGITPILRQDQFIKLVSRAVAIAIASWPCAKFHRPWSSINQRFPEELAGHNRIVSCLPGLSRRSPQDTRIHQECLTTLKPNKQLCVSRVCVRAPAQDFQPMEDLTAHVRPRVGHIQ